MGVINGDNEQVTINVNDTIPPENVATIDLNGKIGNAISKEQFQEEFDEKSDQLDEKIAEIKAQVETDFQGTIKPSDPAPTADGSYKPEVSSADPGTNYPNANDLKAREGYSTLFYKKGTAWTKSEEKLPALTAVTEFDPENNTEPSTMKATADRYDSTVSRVNNVVKTESTDITEYRSFVLAAGQAVANGSTNTSVNWLNAIVNSGFSVGDILTIKGFGLNTSITSGAVPRVLFYKGSPSAANLISVINHSGLEQSFAVPALTQVIYVNIDGATNVGVDLANSPYKESFKIYKTIVGVDVLFLDVTKIKETDRIETDQILKIEEDIYKQANVSTIFDGTGFPQYELGKNGDKYFDKSSKRIFIKNKGYWQPQSLYRDLPFSIPSEFTFVPAYPIRQMDNGKYYLNWGGLFVEKVKNDYDSITKYYVDNVNGSNTNDGLSLQTAVKTIAYARDTLLARNIILAPGIYWADEHFKVFTENNTTTLPMIVRCISGFATFINAQKASQYTWTANGACYQTVRTNVVSVLDLTNVDKNNVYQNLKKVTSIAECQTTLNSWYINGGDLYVHTFNGRIPDANIALNFETVNQYTSGQNVPYVYFENIINYTDRFDNGFMFRNNQTTQFDCKVYLKNVFSYGNTRGNGIAIDNIKEAILEGCGGGNVLRDALNYHTSLLSSGYTPMKVIEIDCFGFNTGLGSSETSSNGSTSHEGSSIIRLNGNFENAMGPVIADVNDGALSLNIGITATNTFLAASDSFRINGNNSKMWVYYGTAYSDLAGTKSIGADTGSVAYYDKNSFLGNGYRGTVTEL